MVQTKSDDSAICRTSDYRGDSDLRRGETVSAKTGKPKNADVRGVGGWRAHLYRDHAALKSAWQELERAGCCTPFQTYDWVSAWYETLASTASAEPLVVTVSRSQDPEIILPLCLYQKGRLRIVSFPDLGVSDYSGPVFAPGSIQTPREARNMMAAVLKTLPVCDLIQFRQFPEKIDGEPNPLFWLEGVECLPDEASFGVQLREDWETQAEEIMDRPLLSTIKRRRAQVTKNGAVIYDRIRDPAEINEVWEPLVDMRRERFLKLGRHDILTNPIIQNFYKLLLTRSDRVLDASITRMTVAGETIASCFGVTRGDIYYMLMPAFQMGRWEHFVPGMQLFYEMMRTQAASGAGYFDFTIGDEGYKLRFGAKRQPLYEWRKPLSAKGSLSHGVWVGKTTLRKHPKLLSLARNIKATFSR